MSRPRGKEKQTIICDGGGSPHEGSAVRYRGSSGCRGAGCREAMRLYGIALRAELAQRGDVPHGTESGYQNWGCRCPACTAAYSIHNARHRAARKLAAGVPPSALTPMELTAYEAGPPGAR